MRRGQLMVVAASMAVACTHRPSPITTPEPVRGAVGDTVRVIVNHVRNDRRDEFERFLHETLYPAMVQAAPTDSITARQMQRARVLRPTTMSADSTWSYIFIVDPVVSSASYSFPRLFAKVFAPAKADTAMQSFRESLARPSETYLLVNEHW
jgi:hypothetical protein